ncbi:hypothetical protein GCM10011578_033300 [Streptomyces fuscichromogenes]|uniref:Uncharacterized protein n=1 Tax=Streptomyces fuscichromogenes TaxID=1324013 RepID=A0A918CRS4_9ACTN|nr:hypothetical protein GCM10011578_033300 [Streptomyces fuscichromogenes]
MHRKLAERLWCAHPALVWATNNPRVIDLGVSPGAGDENRTRALSLGSDGAWASALLLTCPYADSAAASPGPEVPLLTVVVRSYGHAMGTTPQRGWPIGLDPTDFGPYDEQSGARRRVTLWREGKKCDQLGTDLGKPDTWGQEAM